MSNPSHHQPLITPPLDISYPPNSSESKNFAQKKHQMKKSISVKENLLAEAWERKRDHMLHNELICVVKEEERAATPEEVAPAASMASDDESLFSHIQASATTRRPRSRRSLTDDDFDELRGFIDLGFRFNQAICNPDLCVTLPALQVYYAVSQKLHDSDGPSSPVSTLQGFPESPMSSSPSSTASWTITKPGDEPEAVKVRLKQWARAVAYTVRQSC